MMQTQTLHRVTVAEFRAALGFARMVDANVHSYTSAPPDMPNEATYYVTDDGESGFGVTHDGELVGVFSLHRGRGDMLVSSAVEVGATSLDCFDGYLPKLYARHGWVEVGREPNWHAGGPDVVYMAHA